MKKSTKTSPATKLMFDKLKESIRELKTELQGANRLIDNVQARLRDEREARSRDIAAAYANGIRLAEETLELVAEREEQDAHKASLKGDVPTELYLLRKAATFRLAAHRVRFEIPSQTDTCEMPASSSTTRVKGEVGAALANAVKTLASIGKEASR